ncbi:MAG: apolipoprotein N-acyltransferase [Planctomycetota bacterium]
MSGEAGSGQTADGSDGRWPTLRWGLFSAVTLWLAQPPVGWWLLAWVAPIGWLMIVRRDAATDGSLDRRDWLCIYASGVVYWAAACHWVCLPHPLTPIGWVFLSLYLGLYPTAFVWLTRVATRRVRVPLWLAAPVVWVGLECLQARLFSGLLMGALSHSQASVFWSALVAPTSGAFGVSFLVIAVAAFVTPSRKCGKGANGRVLIVGRFACLLAIVGGIGSFGSSMFDEAAEAASRSAVAEQGALTVAVIQGNTLATWDHDFDERNRQIMDRQSALSVEAVERARANGKTLDLIVWPESMFRTPLDTFGGQLTAPGWADEGLRLRRKNLADWFRSLTAKLGTPLLVGLDRFDWRPATNDAADGPDGFPTADVYNTAALIDRSGELVAIYDKTHLVPFGEYIPLLSGVPALYFLTPVGAGMAAGDGPVAFELETADGRTVTIAPSICFETVVPRVIRRQVAELTDAGTPPDLLVNITNDAWFWGSAELDTHLACAQYRAAETGTPMVVAANGGLSAVIDGSGRVLDVGPRMEEHVLIYDVPLKRDDSPTPYVLYGDWFALSCLALCGVAAILGVLPRKGTTDDTDKYG